MDKLQKDEYARCDLNHAMYAWNNELKNFTCDEKDCDHFYWQKVGTKNSKRKVKRNKLQENKCENNM